MRVHPDWCECRSCLKAEEAQERAALHDLDAEEGRRLLDGTGFDSTGIERALSSRVDDDPAVEAELGKPPSRGPTDYDDWIEWAKGKLDPDEQAGV